MSSFFTKMRQILTLGGGGRQFEIVLQRQNMSKLYYAHDPKSGRATTVFLKALELVLAMSKSLFDALEKVVFEEYAV